MQKTGWDAVPNAWKDEIEIRKRHMAKMCKKYNIANTPVNLSAVYPLKQIYVEDRHQLLFCEVPKAGWTNWKKLLLELSGNFKWKMLQNYTQDEVHHFRLANFLTPLARYSKYGREFRLKNYLKFMFVRNPLERLLSSYRDKFEDPFDPYLNKWGRYIVKNFKESPTQEELRTGRGVTFEEFVRFLLDEYKKKHSLKDISDIHWERYFELCSPCGMNYDVIGTYETIVTDANNILKMVDAQEIKYPSFTSYYRKTQTVMDKYYEQIDRSEMKELINLYKPDADMFGYNVQLDRFHFESQALRRDPDDFIMDKFR